MCAQYLARAGYDVAITARTVHEGEAREHSSTLKKSKTNPLPGSLESTAALVTAEGAKALPVAADLLDPVSLGVCVTTVLERWGASTWWCTTGATSGRATWTGSSRRRSS